MVSRKTLKWIANQNYDVRNPFQAKSKRYLENTNKILAFSATKPDFSD